MSQKRFTNIWHMCRGNDLRASSGKFLRIKVCRPEILDFLGLWRRMPKAVTEIGFKSNFLEIIKPFCLLVRTDKTWLAGIEKNHSRNVCVERKMSHFE